MNRFPLSASQCDVAFLMIIPVLTPFKFPFTLNPLTRVPSYTHFIFGTDTYCSSSTCCDSSSCPSISSSSSIAFFLCLSISLVHTQYFASLLYNKEVVPRTLFCLIVGGVCVCVCVCVYLCVWGQVANFEEKTFKFIKL